MGNAIAHSDRQQSTRRTERRCATARPKRIPAAGAAILEDNTIAIYERRIAEAAQNVLRSTGYYQLSLVRCIYQYRGGVLVLEGTVASFYMKQVAQTVVKTVEQVYEIRNQVDVVYPT